MNKIFVSQAISVCMATSIWLVIGYLQMQLVEAFVSFPIQICNLKQTSLRKSLKVLQIKRGQTQELKEAVEQEEDTYIRFSRAFQRHVVYKSSDTRKQKSVSICHDWQCDHTLESFVFLDEAMEEYPNATLDRLLDIGEMRDEDDFELILAGMGIIPSSMMLTKRSQDTNTGDGIQALYYLGSKAMSGQRIHLPPSGSKQFNQLRDTYIQKLGLEISPKRFESHTPELIRQNYDLVVDLLTRGSDKSVVGTREGSMLTQLAKFGLAFTEADAKAVIADFPQLCLYDINELEERIKFLTSPIELQTCTLDKVKKVKTRNAKKVGVDFYCMMRRGYGAGLSVQQATQIVRAVPQFLSIYHEDSLKSNIFYFCRELDIPTRFLEQARTELGHRIIGGEASDTYAFAFLNSIGISWAQIRLLLDAFPVITYCDKEPAWELLDNRGPMRKELNPSVLNFLRKRLQISNSDLHAMIKTHSRLASYSVSNGFLPKLNAIQGRLMLSTKELQRVVLRMPSVTGMSTDSSKQLSALDKRIDFFLNEAKLNPVDLREAIIKQPSLLQYGISSSLRPKLKFLMDELSIEEELISRVVRAAPAILGLSLEHNLRPKILILQEECDLSTQDIANMIITVPSILLLSQKRKIQPCLDFLRTELQLYSSSDLGRLLQTCPRILTHGVDTSLSPKIQMITSGLVEEGLPAEIAFQQTLNIVKTNPALLVTTNSLLQSRIHKYLQDDNTSLEASLKPRLVGRKRITRILNCSTDVDEENALTDQVPRKKKKRNHRSILEINDDQKIMITYPSVKAAAEQLEVSLSSIYTACGKGIPVKGKRLCYSNDSADEIYPSYSFQDLLKLPFKLYDGDSDTVSIAAISSGCIYPSDDINSVRGMRKSGGIAIQIPQATQTSNLSKANFEDATKMSFGMIMPHTEDGACSEDGIVQAGFPFLRPSRARCDLYACHGALKVILQLLKQAAEVRDMRETTVNIVIYTDSTYAWNLLKDTDSLLELGSAPTQAEASFEVSGPLPLANPDLLYPLTKTMHRMTNNAVINRRRNKRLCIGKNVNISFRYVGDLSFDKDNNQRFRDLHTSAKLAALWQFKMG